MGQIRAFHCTSCDYSAEVSAGDDAGMAVTTTTVLCEDCQALMDVVTGKREQAFVAITPKCGRRKRHHVTPWSFPGPCPRCHAPMAEDPDGPVILWD